MKRLPLLFPLAVLAMLPLVLGESGTNPERDAYGGFTALKSEATGFFRLGAFGASAERPLLVTPEGHGFLALGVNHIGALSQVGKRDEAVRGKEAWLAYWESTLRPRYEAWHCNTTGYGGPTELRSVLPWFGSFQAAPIEKHRSDARAGLASSYAFPDVFDPAWEQQVSSKIRKTVAPHKEDPFLVGWFWTDTPTWDLQKTRALRGTNWVSAIRSLSSDAPGRKVYERFLAERYGNRLKELNEFYGLSLASLDALAGADLTRVAVGRHRVQEDDLAFLGKIAERYYQVIGTAQREADPNHLVFGERYLAGDAPTVVLEAAAPWIDAVAVQPGDRYSPLYPPSTRYPEAEIEHLHQVTGKPVFICDHAISFPSEAQPRTIFEQMPT